MFLHFILHQEALCAKSLKKLIQTANFIRASVLERSEFKALLEQVQSKYN